MLVGIDEVGRGCWAGPVTAAAVLFGRRSVKGVKDSKRLTRIQREKLDTEIRKTAMAYGIGWATAAEVDEFGMTKAVRLAMQRALDKIAAPYREVVVDGGVNYLKDNPKVRSMPKADGVLSCVGAASIIAKVARDKHMAALSKQYPGYLFEKHVGYGTAAHQEALRALGACDIHRRSFKPIAELS